MLRTQIHPLLTLQPLLLVLAWLLLVLEWLLLVPEWWLVLELSLSGQKSSWLAEASWLAVVAVWGAKLVVVEDQELASPQVQLLALLAEAAVAEEGEEVVELVAVEQPVQVVQEHLQEELVVEQGQAVWWPPQPPQGL